MARHPQRIDHCRSKLNSNSPPPMRSEELIFASDDLLQPQVSHSTPARAGIPPTRHKAQQVQHTTTSKRYQLIAKPTVNFLLARREGNRTPRGRPIAECYFSEAVALPQAMQQVCAGAPAPLRIPAHLASLRVVRSIVLPVFARGYAVHTRHESAIGEAKGLLPHHLSRCMAHLPGAGLITRRLKPQQRNTRPLIGTSPVEKAFRRTTESRQTLSFQARSNLVAHSLYI
jgi:hypothetical protein